MDGGSFGNAFRAVDESDEAEALHDFLVRVRQVPAVAAAKRESLELLDAPAGARILDVGCGAGDDLAELAQLVGSSGAVAGVDNSAVLVERAQRRLAASDAAVEVICADGAALPFDRASFSAARADRTLQHLPDPDAALREMARVVEPGGAVVVSEMRTLIDRGSAADPVARELIERTWPEDAAQGWFALMLPLLFARAGLEDVEVRRRHVRLDSFEQGALLLRLHEAREGAVGAGSLDAATVDGWLNELAADVEAERAAMVCDFVHVRGRTPPGEGPR